MEVENGKKCSSVRTSGNDEAFIVADENIEFQIVLNDHEWNSIKPVIKKYENGTERKIMQAWWCDTLTEKIWQTTNISCVFNFNNHHIGQLCFFSTTALCTECNSNLNITLINELGSGSVYFEAIAEKVRFNVPHSNCRRLAGPKREIVKKELCHQLPRKWQRREAAKIMNDNDRNAPHLYKLPTLQKARLDGKYDELGIKKS